MRSVNFDADFDYTIDDNTLIFDNGGVAGSSGIGTSETNGSGDHTIDSDLQANNDILIRNNNTGSLTLNGDLDTGGNTITFDGTGDAAADNGAITGSGSIVKNDSGTATFSGSNTYSDDTTINDGKIVLGASDTVGSGSDVSIASSGILDLDGNSQAIGDLIAAEGAILDFGTPGAANTFVFDTYTPPPASGIMVVNNWSENDSDQLATTVAFQDVSSVYLSGTGVAQQDPGLTALGGGYGSGYLLTPAYIQEIQWEGTGTVWNTAGNWVENDVPSWRQEVAIFGLLGQDELDVDLNVTEQVGGIRFAADATESYTISSATNDLIMQGAVPYIQQLSDVDHTIAFDELKLDANTVADFTGSGDLIISADIVDGSGRYALVRDGIGTGKLILSGDNSFSAGLFINTGIVQAQSDTALGSDDVTISSGGTLQLTNDITADQNDITVSGTGSAGNGAR